MRTLLIWLVASVSMAGWEDCPPLRERKGYVPALADVECHLEKPNEFYSSDQGTFTHEGTHGVNAQIRFGRGGFNAFYVLGNRCMVLREPNVTLSTLANSIKVRGKAFWYLQRGVWDNQPLYVLDELTAYINGCQAYLELGKGADYAHSRDYAWDLLRYARILAEIVRRRQPDYVDQKHLDEYLDYCERRLIIMEPTDA